MARTTRIQLAKYLIKIDDIYPAMLDGPEKIRPIIFSRFLFLLRPFFQRAPRLVSWTDSRLSFEWASNIFSFFSGSFTINGIPFLLVSNRKFVRLWLGNIPNQAQRRLSANMFFFYIQARVSIQNVTGTYHCQLFLLTFYTKPTESFILYMCYVEQINLQAKPN